MITIVTGLPGHGKTLLTMYMVKALADKEHRPVFQSGIDGCAVPGWQEIDGEKWYEAPAGSIVIIDEGQRIFRPRGQGQKVPKAEEELETHRHAGIDIWITTQHPMLLSANVRRLAGRHYHVMRPYGLQMANVHRWDSVKLDCDRNRKDSIEAKIKYPQEVYGWYKSAEVHTHRRAIPARLLWGVVVPVVLVGAGYVAYNKLRPSHQQEIRAEQARPNVGSAGQPAGRGPAVAQAGPAHVQTADEYVESYTPRIPGLLHTAPRYDQVLQVTQAPTIGGCIADEHRCLCYTQQGTRLPVPDETCRNIVAHGWFDEYRRPEPVQAEPVPGPVGPEATGSNVS